MHAWRHFQTRWMHKRIPLGQHQLNKRTVFILPTRHGIYLILFLIAMLLACINYNLSLGYFLTFFVFSIALGGMHRTHQNLVGLQITALEANAVFANETATLTLQVRNPSAQHKYAIRFSVGSDPSKHTDFTFEQSSDQTISLHLPALKRGVHPVPTLEVACVYPLGIWRAWTYLRPQLKRVVYPLPCTPLPPMRPLSQSFLPSTQLLSSSPTGDALSHIEGAESAPFNRIYWPALARGVLAKKVTDRDVSEPTASVELSLAQCTVSGIEAKLSQLCGAILHCSEHNIRFILNLNLALHSLSDVGLDADAARCDPVYVQASLLRLASHE